MAVSGTHWDTCCVICLDSLEEHVTLPCGHNLCMNCILTLRGKEDEKKIYNCPVCLRTFTSRDMVKNTTLENKMKILEQMMESLNSDLAEELKQKKLLLRELREKQVEQNAEMKKTAEQEKLLSMECLGGDCYAGDEDVACDICTGRKFKAFKLCPVCQASFCRKHVKRHLYDPFFQKHKLVNLKNTQENMCSRHDEVLQIFCRTDQQWICPICAVDDHKGHNIVSAGEERHDKQRELEKSQQKLHQRIQDIEKDVKILQQKIESSISSGEQEVVDREKILTKLSLVKELQEKLAWETAELKVRNAEVEKLLLNEDPGGHIYAEHEDVACDVCSDRKRKAFKSCQVCLASFCEEHIQPHFKYPALQKHKLVGLNKMQENICSRHDEVLLTRFCRTDQQCVCHICAEDDHKGHDIVSAAEERREKRRELEKSQQTIQQEIQRKAIDAKMLQLEIESISSLVDKEFNNIDKILFRLSLTKELQEKLAQETAELKANEAEVEWMSSIEDPGGHCYAGDKDVACDVCTGRKRKASKSCPVCQASYCEEHIQPHFEYPLFQNHKLVDINDMQEVQRIQDREKDVKMLQDTVESICSSLDKAAEDREKIINELNFIKDLQRLLACETAELKVKNVELKKLLSIEDHIRFLQSYSSFSLFGASRHSSSVTSATNIPPTATEVDNLLPQTEQLCISEECPSPTKQDPNTPHIPSTDPPLFMEFSDPLGLQASSSLNLEASGAGKESTDWTKVEPEVSNEDEDFPTYSLQSEAGMFECSISELRWVCKETVAFEYQFCSWEEHIDRMESLFYMPAGPLLNITVITGKLDEVYLPHWICIDDPAVVDKFAVLHIDDCGYAVEQASEIASSHIKLLEPVFSPRGGLMKLGFPVKWSCRVLMFYKTNTTFLKLHVYLIPHDSSLMKTVEKHEAKFGYAPLNKPSPDPRLKMKNVFSLHADTDRAKICPKKITLRYEVPNPNFFELYIPSLEGDFNLLLANSNTGKPVWDCNMYKVDFDNPGNLNAAGAPTGGATSPEKQTVAEHQTQRAAPVLTSHDWLLEILEHLSNEEFGRFKWYLKNKKVCENLLCIPLSQVEKADRVRLVDLMVQTYTTHAEEVTRNILEKIPRKDLL